MHNNTCSGKDILNCIFSYCELMKNGTCAEIDKNVISFITIPCFIIILSLCILTSIFVILYMICIYDPIGIKTYRCQGCIFISIYVYCLILISILQASLIILIVYKNMSSGYAIISTIIVILSPVVVCFICYLIHLRKMSSYKIYPVDLKKSKNITFELI